MTAHEVSSAPLTDWEEVAPWMTRQRWFANKGGSPALEEIGSFGFDSAEDGVRIITHLLLDHTVGKPALYQVPLTYRVEPLDGATGALVGRLDGLYVYDAPHDRAYTAALLEFIGDHQEVRGDRTWAIGHATSARHSSGLVSRVLTGEQSNTSIIFQGAAGTVPVICKLFRALHDGENPDVVLQTALALAGSDSVPAPVGHIVAEWDDRGESTGRAKGHLAFAQEFLPGVEDGWRVALDAARAGTDFTHEARELGIATAGMHATLAVALGSAPVLADDIASTVGFMLGRLDLAASEVPDFRPLEPVVQGVFSDAARAAWPALQRIHGDLHLGQVLHVPDRGWVIVDFEGEPLRPMTERSQLDSPLRDVAGMLHSFGYVAGAVRLEGGPSAEAWADAARRAFVTAYDEAAGTDFGNSRELLAAYELDKALYQTVYEVRNRPDWLPISIAAVQTLAQTAG